MHESIECHYESAWAMEGEQKQKVDCFLTSVLGGFLWGFPVNHGDGGKSIRSGAGRSIYVWPGSHQMGSRNPWIVYWRLIHYFGWSAIVWSVVQPLCMFFSLSHSRKAEVRGLLSMIGWLQVGSNFFLKKIRIQDLQYLRLPRVFNTAHTRLYSPRSCRA